MASATLAKPAASDIWVKQLPSFTNPMFCFLAAIATYSWPFRMI